MTGSLGATSETEVIFTEIREYYPDGVPNLYRTLSAAPNVLAAFVKLDEKLMQGTLCEGERLLVGLLTALENGCPYCRAALSKEAVEAGAKKEAVEAALSCARLADARIDTLLIATRRIIETRGRLPMAEIDWFAQRGFKADALVEIIATVSEFTLATYANNLLRTRIDPEYRGFGVPGQNTEPSPELENGPDSGGNGESLQDRR